MKNNGRICIYPKDIARITGKSERYSRKIAEKIREKYSKQQDQFISVEEFCDYTGLRVEHVEPLLFG